MNKFIKGTLVVLTASIIITSIRGSDVNAQGNVSADLNLKSYSVTETTKINQVKSGFSDVKSDHWAVESINSAVRKGYVAGYKDGTFRPSNDVTRAEFVKMIATSANLKLGADGSKWYLPTLDAAKSEGWVTASDFTDGNMNKAMTRLEMSKVAVRAIGGKATSNAEYMLVAVENGIISGVSKGNLAPEGLTTRAQSVAVIDRVLVINTGGKLPVDADALLVAQQAVGAKKDAWGSSIRTNDLPSNYSDYHYILEGFPNAYYEMPYKSVFGDIKLPNVYFPKQDINVEDMGTLKQNIEKWFNLMFNLDYRTIDDSWVDNMFEVMNVSGHYTPTGKEKFYNTNKKYVQWVKDNKLVTEGTAKVDMGSIAKVDSWPSIKVLLTYKVVEGNKDAIVWTGSNNDSIFRGHTRHHESLYSNYKLGTPITVVTQVKVDGKVDSILNKYTVSGDIDISENFIEVK